LYLLDASSCSDTVLNLIKLVVQIISFSLFRFKLWNILFVFVRLTSITLSVLTFWYGLAANFKGLSWPEANAQENKYVIRSYFYFFNFFALFLHYYVPFLELFKKHHLLTEILTLKWSGGYISTLYSLYSYIKIQTLFFFLNFCHRINCLLALCFLQTWMMWNFITFHLKRMRERALEAQQQRKKQNRNQAKKSSKKPDDDVNELPEVDQNTKKSLTQRSAAKVGKVKH